jgi:hypothetical protein
LRYPSSVSTPMMGIAEKLLHPSYISYVITFGSLRQALSFGRHLNVPRQLAKIDISAGKNNANTLTLHINIAFENGGERRAT